MVTYQSGFSWGGVADRLCCCAVWVIGHASPIENLCNTYMKADHSILGRAVWHHVSNEIVPNHLSVVVTLVVIGFSYALGKQARNKPMKLAKNQMPIFDWLMHWKKTILILILVLRLYHSPSEFKILAVCGYKVRNLWARGVDGCLVLACSYSGTPLIKQNPLLIYVLIYISEVPQWEPDSKIIICNISHFMKQLNRKSNILHLFLLLTLFIQ